MSDAIFVVNVDKYVGPSTFSNIDWAVRNKKEVYFLVNPKDTEEEDSSEEPSVENVEAEKVD